MKTTLLTALLALFYATAYAQDPVKVSPQYYKVLLENNAVRVLDLASNPEKKSRCIPPIRRVSFMSSAGPN